MGGPLKEAVVIFRNYPVSNCGLIAETWFPQLQFGPKEKVIAEEARNLLFSNCGPIAQLQTGFANKRLVSLVGFWRREDPAGAFEHLRWRGAPGVFAFHPPERRQAQSS